MMLFCNSGAIARYSGNSANSAKKKNSFAPRAKGRYRVLFKTLKKIMKLLGNFGGFF
jgi:hypothetical protein